MTNRLNDSCGCAMGAVFTVAGLLAATAFYGWQFYHKDLTMLSSGLRVAVAAFLSAGAGKIVGITRHHLQQKQFFPMYLARLSLIRKEN